MMSNKKADPTKLAADMSPPNYRAAVQRLRTIPAKKDKIASVNGDIADIYAKVEGHKVNRKAARIFVALDKLEKAERDDIMRSFDGLADAAGWDEESADLVDQAEDNVVPLRMRGSGTSEADGDDDGADENLDELEAETEASRADSFIANARKHLGSDQADAGAHDGAK